jgi:hypothetical protein
VVFGADWAPLKDIIIVTLNTEVPSHKPTLLQWKSGLIRGMASFEMDKGQETWKRWIRQEIYLNEAIRSSLSKCFCTDCEQCMSTYKFLLTAIDSCNSPRWVLDSPFSVGTPHSSQILDSYYVGTLCIPVYICII